MNIEKFNDFCKQRIDNYDKTQSLSPLSNDILAFKTLENGDLEIIKDDIDIIEITGILNDNDVKHIEKQIKENFNVDTSLTITDVKKGKILWLTAILKKQNSTAWNSQQMGVIKVRVVDYFYGLNKLNTLKNSQINDDKKV